MQCIDHFYHHVYCYRKLRKSCFLLCSFQKIVYRNSKQTKANLWLNVHGKEMNKQVNKEKNRKQKARATILRVLVTVPISEPPPIHWLIFSCYFMDCDYLIPMCKSLNCVIKRGQCILQIFYILGSNSD